MIKGRTVSLATHLYMLRPSLNVGVYQDWLLGLWRYNFKGLKFAILEDINSEKRESILFWISGCLKLREELRHWKIFEVSKNYVIKWNARGILLVWHQCWHVLLNGLKNQREVTLQRNNIQNQRCRRHLEDSRGDLLFREHE